MSLILFAALAFAQEAVPAIQPGSPGAHLGAADARWTIVQFSDWQCPHCARAFARLDEFVASDPSTKVVFKVFPLSGECNPTLTSTGSARCVLAYGGVCAAEQDGWVAYARWAMGEMTSLSGATNDTLVAKAPSLGLDAGRFEACLASPGAKQRVQADALEGARLEVRGTPTFYVFDPGKGEWIPASGGGADGAITVLEALRNGVVEQP